MKPTWVLLAWGFLLGSGIATLVPYSAFVLVLGAELAGGLSVAALCGAVYGLSRELPVALALGGRLQTARAVSMLPRYRVHASVTNVGVILVGGLLLLLFA
jgi:hypothetical protein